MSTEKERIAVLESRLGGLEKGIEEVKEIQRHNCEVSNKKDEEILLAIEELSIHVKTKIKEQSILFENKIKSHLDYHDKNEHLMGIIAFMKKKPLITFISGGLIFSAFGISTAQIIKLIQKIILK